MISKPHLALLIAAGTLLPTMVCAEEQAADPALGAITGTVAFQGDNPRAAVADDTGQRRTLLHVDRKTRGLRYAIAYLVTTDRPAKPPRPQKNESAGKPVIIDQRENTFKPHLVAIRSGERILFTNSDTANHNVRGSSLNAKNEFNIFTGAGGDYSKQFFADRNRPVRLGCDIHPWMQAWVYAFDHPYYAVTDQRGQFRIANVPAGSYELVIRQPDGGLNRKLTVDVKAGQVKRLKVEFTAAELKGV